MNIEYSYRLDDRILLYLPDATGRTVERRLPHKKRAF